ncbi:hypothetical protein, partial [Bacteroides acidifaciens]|uniref:hypothetical protein n=1 Tax=Bacteroides acidifaciens TaxID=85831 RepID=UPI002675F242
PHYTLDTLSRPPEKSADPILIVMRVAIGAYLFLCQLNVLIVSMYFKFTQIRSDTFNPTLPPRNHKL